MSRIDSLETLLVNELRDLLHAETQITKALPKMIKATDSEELSEALQSHLDETEGQIKRLEQAFELLDETARPKMCHGMKGLLDEGSEHMKEEYSDPSLCDVAIIASAQKVEHYEISAYGTAATLAQITGHEDVMRLLLQTLTEEKKADETLTHIAERQVNIEAAASDDDESGATNGSPRSMSSRKKAPARSSRSRATHS